MEPSWRSCVARVFLGACLSLLPAARTAAETVFQVRNIFAPPGSSNPTELTPVNGAIFEPATLYFVADDGATGMELWKSDGTEGGTTLVKDIVLGLTSSLASRLTRVSGGFLGAGRLFFTAGDGANGVELWKSDGTPAGTQMVKNINGNLTSSDIDHLTAVAGSGFGAGRLFFVADDGVSGVELWTSDGTTGGTVRVKNINPTGSSSPSELTAVGSTLYFSADNGTDGRELWMSDGTEPGTVRVKDINVGPGPSNPTKLVDVNGTLFFLAFTPNAGGELWKSNGTEAGTMMVKDIRPGVGVGSNSSQLVAVGTTLFLQSDDGTHGRELWKSDGTGPGTVMVAEINPTGDAFVPNAFIGVVVSTGDTLFFVADDGTHGNELWKSDGTAPGTALVKDIYAGSTESGIESLTNVNGIVYFAARNTPTNYELWRSDGREAGTFQVGDIFPGPADAAPYDLAAAYPFLFFSASGTEGRELFATDLVFLDGFESGNAAVWSSASEDGGDLSVQPAAALHGAQGLSVFVDDTAGLFVADGSPNNEIRYRARFRFDPNGFDPGVANGKLRVRLLIAFEEDPSLRVFTLVLRRLAGGQYSLRARARLDDGSRADTPFVDITDDAHLIELDWEWSPGPDANDGSLALWIDEVPVSTLTGLDNSASTIDFVRLGAMTVKPGANGTMYFDGFESRRERYIGALP